MKFLLISLKILPTLTILVAIVEGSTLRLGGYPLLPALFLIPIYYWLIFRPDWVPLWGLVCIGLFYDALIGSDLGISSLLLGLSALLGHMMRPFLSPQHFLLIWANFACYSLCYLGLYGLLSSGGLPLLFSWIYGVILYPLLAWVLSHLHLRLQAHV